MATQHEMYTNAKREYTILCNAWKVLFPEDGITLGHFPSSINHLLDHVVEVFTAECQGAAEEVRKEDPELDEEEAEMVATIVFMKNMAFQFYQLGQYLADELPYDKLTPCPCEVLTDEDINKLLEG